MDLLTNILAGTTVTLLLSSVGQGFVISNRNYEIGSLESEVSELAGRLVLETSNTAKALHSIATQNTAINKLKVDLNASDYRWNNRVPAVTIVEKWRTKYVDRNITIQEGNCEEDTFILDAVRRDGF